MFKVPNLRHSLDKDMLMRLVMVIPRSYLERRIDKYFCLGIMKLWVLISGTEKLKIGLLGVGGLIFLGAIAMQNAIALIGSVIFTCGVAIAIFGFGD